LGRVRPWGGLAGLEFGDRLKMIMIDYELRLVKVVFLKNVRALPTPSGRIDVKRGDEVEIPRWQARILEQAGVAEIREKELDIDGINMYHYKEKRKTAPNQLSQLPQDFYLKARDLVARLNELIRENPSHMLLRDREIVEKNLVELAETRLAKIVRLALTGGEEFRDRMTPEESMIYDEVSDIAKAWRKYIESIFYVGEK